MAFVNCGYCGAHISDKAAVCIKCGAPAEAKTPTEAKIAVETQTPPLPEPTVAATVNQTPPKKSSSGGMIFGLLAIGAVVLMVKMCHHGKSPEEIANDPDLVKMKPFYHSVLEAQASLAAVDNKLMADTREAEKTDLSANRRHEVEANIDNELDQLCQLKITVSKIKVPAIQNPGAQPVALFLLGELDSVMTNCDDLKGVNTGHTDMIRHGDFEAIIRMINAHGSHYQFDKYLKSLNSELGVTTEQMMQ